MNLARMSVCSLALLAGPILVAQTYKLKEGDSITVRYVLRTDGLGVPTGMEGTNQGGQGTSARDSNELKLEVPPGGAVTLPFVGDIKAAGISVTALQNEITKHLRKRFALAEAFVILTTIRPTFYSIIGEVKQGGQFPLPPGLTLREALAIAGGTLRRPELLRAAIFRDGKLYKEFDLFNVASGDEPIGREPLQAGDVVSIQTRRQLRVWTAGLTSRPGEVTIESGRTLQELLAEVVSFTGGDTAWKERRETVFATITRGGQTVFHDTLFNVDTARAPVLYLQDGDYVTLAPQEAARVWVFGSVARPGQYDVPVTANVLQAIAAAGGASREATLKNLRVLRNGGAVLLDVSSSSSRPQDKEQGVMPGDIIVVSDNTSRVAVLGEVRNPGVHYIRDEIEMTVADAIGLAGGLTRRGPATRVAILRQNADGKIVRLPVDLSKFLKDGRAEANPKVLPGDVVVVGETNRIEIGDILNTAFGLFGLRNLIR